MDSGLLVNSADAFSRNFLHPHAESVLRFLNSLFVSQLQSLQKSFTQSLYINFVQFQITSPREPRLLDQLYFLIVSSILTCNFGFLGTFLLRTLQSSTFLILFLSLPKSCNHGSFTQFLNINFVQFQITNHREPNLSNKPSFSSLHQSLGIKFFTLETFLLRTQESSTFSIFFLSSLKVAITDRSRSFCTSTLSSSRS